MVSAMSGAPVVVTPTSLGRGQQLSDGIEQIAVASRARLDDGYTGGGVWYEHREQPITMLSDKPDDLSGDVHHRRPISCL